MRIGPEVFARIGAAGGAVFARDGGTLFHLRGAGLPQAWALDLASGEARQLTFRDEKVALLRRCPTDDRLVYGIDRGGDERQQLWLIDPSEEQRRRGADRRSGGDPRLGRLVSPDGTRIAFAANARDEAHFDVFVQEVASGVRHVRLRRAAASSASRGFGPDGAVLALVADRGYGDMSVLLLIWRAGEVAAFPSASRNELPERAMGERRAHAAGADRSWAAAISCGCAGSIRTAAPSSVVYAADGRDVEAWAMSSDGAMLATVENDRGYAVLRVGAGGRRAAGRGRSAARRDQRSGFAPDGRALAFTRGRADRSGLDLAVAATGPPRPLVQPEAVVGPATVRRSRAGGVGEFDGRHGIPGWLALPPGEVPAGGLSGGDLGAWRAGGQTRPNFRPDMQMLLAQGFAVLMPNVRGSTGYGRAYDRERRCRAAARQRGGPGARPALAGGAPGDRCRRASASWASPTAGSW